MRAINNIGSFFSYGDLRRQKTETFAINIGITNYNIFPVSLKIMKFQSNWGHFKIYRRNQRN